jgi:hypothetical protein
MNRSAAIIALLVIAFGVLSIGPLNRRLVEARRQYGINQADPLINAPPLVVFTTVALGGFRGIFADMLWMRSARLQHEGKYFELVQLADWITKLEPRFTEVWAYHAWNLTYNISVLFTDPADRWRWVRHGIGLLRDEGLHYNPGEARLLYELGWFFQHKIGANMDDAHLYYKQAWAAEMQALLGGGRVDYEQLEADPLRRQALMERYKLDPGIMRELEGRYGPLDWRLPQAHAIYWAHLSKRVGNDRDGVMADRMIYQSMTDAFRRGKLFLGADEDRFIPSPQLELLPYVMRAYEAAIANPDERGTALTGYRYFLSESAILLYLYNRMPEAREVFARLKELNPEIDPAIDMVEYIFQAFTKKGLNMSQDEAYAAVESALVQSLQWGVAGDAERAAGYDQMARMIWNRYMAPRLDRPDLRQRTGLPPIDEIYTQARRRLAER